MPIGRGCSLMDAYWCKAPGFMFKLQALGLKLQAPTSSSKLQTNGNFKQKNLKPRRLKFSFEI